MSIGSLSTEQELDSWLKQRLGVHLPGNVQEQIAAAAGAVQTVAEGAYNPPGTVLYGAWTATPDGYLICDHGSYLIADYPELSAAIRTSFGGADADHFYVPDLRGRVTTGVGTHAEVDTVGFTEAQAGVVRAVGGRKTIHDHTITHSHSMQAHTHSGHTDADDNDQTVAAHTHTHPESGGGTTGVNSVGAQVSDHPHGHDYTTGGPSLANTGGSSAADSGIDGPAYLVLNPVIKT